MVGGAGERFHVVEAGFGNHHQGRGTRWHVPENRSQPTAILPEMRWAPYDQPSAAWLDRCVCGHAAGFDVRTRRSRELCGDGLAHERRSSQTERLPRRVGRVWRGPSGVIAHHLRVRPFKNHVYIVGLNYRLDATKTCPRSFPATGPLPKRAVMASVARSVTGPRRLASRASISFRNGVPSQYATAG